MMYNCGLVLEGGGMRGVYTRGVLNFLSEKGIDFKSIYGVSRGTLNGISYKSRQTERTLRVFMRYRHDKRYMGFKSLVETGNLFNTEFGYHELTEKLEPFDFDEYEKNPSDFYATVTNVVTGKAEYHKVTDARAQIDIIRASASLPMISQIVETEGGAYLDGGIADSIPLEKSQADGNEKNVVILTQHRGYIRKPASGMAVVKKMYKKYPEFIKAYEDRHILANAQTAYAAECEEAGNTFVIAPHKHVDIDRIESDVSKMYEWYAYGRQDARRAYDGLMEFLEK